MMMTGALPHGLLAWCFEIVSRPTNQELMR
jgi:hypothetical protein